MALTNSSGQSRMSFISRRVMSSGCPRCGKIEAACALCWSSRLISRSCSLSVRTAFRTSFSKVPSRETAST